MSLQSVPIDTQLDWLAPAELRNDSSVAKFLPRGFEAYLKILTPIGIDRRIPFEQYSDSTRTIADINNRVQFWNQYEIVSGQPKPENLERITYRQVADLLQVPYDAQFDAASIQQAHNGWPINLGSSSTLDNIFLESLLFVLGPDFPAYFFGEVENGKYHLMADSDPVDWLEFGTVSDLISIKGRDYDYPSYFFAADHSWCLHHLEFDSYLTFCCSTTLSEILFSNSDIEATSIL